jgi:mRNA interferase RelE/StbE
MYSVTLSPLAIRQLNKLNERQIKPILQAITGLRENPRPSGVKKLKGRPGYRIRAGNYRIIYSIFDFELRIEVLAIGDRKDVYR